MKVLLRSDIAGVGRRGDIITVSSGHARNHLLPHGLAIVASEGEVVQAGVMRRSRDLRENTEREAARGVAANLAKQSVKVKARAVCLVRSPQPRSLQHSWIKQASLWIARTSPSTHRFAQLETMWSQSSCTPMLLVCSISLS